MTYLYGFDGVNQQQLDAIQALEKEIGSPLLAMRPVEVSPASPDNATLEKVKKLEEELGLVLVAVAKH
ncbi:hypothetical protein ACTL6U_19465 [Rhodovibrionaceae bacterium A322]